MRRPSPGAKKNAVADRSTQTAPTSAPTRSGSRSPLLDQLGDARRQDRHRRCPADTDTRSPALPAQARRPLHVRGQGQPEDSAQRHPAMVPRRRKTPSATLPTRTWQALSTSKLPTDARTLGTARNLDHHRAQRLSPVPRASGKAFLIRRTRCQDRRTMGRVTDTSSSTTSWGDDQPHPAHRAMPKGCCASTCEPLDHRKTRLHRILDDSDNWNEDNSRIRTGHGPENMTGPAPLCHRRRSKWVARTSSPPPCASCKHPTPAARLSAGCQRQHSAQARHAPDDRRRGASTTIWERQRLPAKS